ncbi:hypothetical protein Ancab_007338 [Ancistrocladus abbreviatus]
MGKTRLAEQQQFARTLSIQSRSEFRTALILMEHCYVLKAGSRTKNDDSQSSQWQQLTSSRLPAQWEDQQLGRRQQRVPVDLIPWSLLISPEGKKAQSLPTKRIQTRLSVKQRENQFLIPIQIPLLFPSHSTGTLDLGFIPS